MSQNPHHFDCSHRKCFQDYSVFFYLIKLWLFKIMNFKTRCLKRYFMNLTQIELSKLIWMKTSLSVGNNYTTHCQSFIWSMLIWSMPTPAYLHETSFFIRLRGLLWRCYVWKWRCLLLKRQGCMQLFRWLFWCKVWIFNEWRLLKILKNSNCGGGELKMFNLVWAVLIDTTILPM